MERFRSLLPTENADDVIGGIKNVLITTYAQNAARHEPELGDDGHTFGTACWRNSWYYFDQIMGNITGVRTHRPNGSLQIDVSDVHLHTYRGGDDETCDIDSFVFDDESSTMKAIPEANQLRLNLEGPEPPVTPIESQLRDLVIVHFGNPDDGLCAVWVGAPLPKPAGMSPWEWRELIYLIDRDDDGVKIEDKPPVTPYSEGAEPEIELQRRPKSGDRGAEPSAG